MKYRPDGRPQSISIVQTALSQECLAFVRTAMTLTVASMDAPVIPERADLVLVYLAPELLACADNPFAAALPRGADLAYERPRVTKPAEVLYPAQFRRTGMPDLEVIMRVRVSHAGCPSSAEVLRGVLPAFDLEAIGSVLASQAASATLGGEPIDGSMTRTVRFSLR
jgi:hypothetical protein